MYIPSVQHYHQERIEAIYGLTIGAMTVADSINDMLNLAVRLTGARGGTVAFFNNYIVFTGSRLGHNYGELQINATALPGCFKETGILVLNELQGGSGIPPIFNEAPSFSSFAAVPLMDAERNITGFVALMNDAPFSADAAASILTATGRQINALIQLSDKILNDAMNQHRNSLAQLEGIFQNDVDAIVITNDAGAITYANPRACHLLEWPAAAITGKPFLDTFIPEDFRNAVAEGRNLLEGNSVSQTSNPNMEIRALTRSGAELDVAIGMSYLSIDDKRYLISYIRNITDHKSAARKIDEQKAFYETILNKLPTDIAVFDPQHKYLFVNPGAISDESLRKYIVGKDDFEYAAYRNRSEDVAQRRRDRFLQAANSDVEIKWEDTLYDPEGVPITHLRRLFPVRNEQGELLMVIGYGIDITERKIMENKQAMLVKQLSVQNTQLTDFCNIVSHNLRAPLVNMSMLVQYIEESEDETDRMELIKMLKPVVENLHGTFGELVESIQIKQDHEVLSEKILLADCVDRTLKELKFEVNKSQAEFQVDFSEAPAILFPSKYLFSIIHNLLSNALKYQSPQRKPLIKIATKKVNDDVILSVADNGLGIDLVKHGKNFFKIGKVFHKNPNAKGFGLFMTKTQVEAMGGTIWVESMPDEGSTFFIEFKNQKF